MAGDSKIRVGALEFDPLLSQPISSSAQTSRDTVRHYIVQLYRAPTLALRQSLTDRHGLRLDNYLPGNAYIEHIEASRLANLVRDSNVRAVIEFGPEFKVSPTLDLPRRSRAPTVRGLMVRVAMFPDADPAAVAATAASLGAREVRVQDDRPLGGAARLLLNVDTPDVVQALAALEGVRWIEPVTSLIMDNIASSRILQPGPPLWNRGLQGEGQIIGIIDSLVDLGHCWFQDFDDNQPGPHHRKIVALRNAAGSAAHSHGTTVCGIAAGDDALRPGGIAGRGLAWAARISFGNKEDVPLNSSLFAYLAAAAEDGARIHSNSWHEEPHPAPQYNQTAADVDAFIWNNEDNLVLGSSGNLGEAMGPPGTAKNALCVSAASENAGELQFADGNSGPTKDVRPRQKPELLALGCGFTTARKGTFCLTEAIGVCASSWATTAAAAAAALVRQYFTEGWYPTGMRDPLNAFVPTGALMKATLLNSTERVGVQSASHPVEGWGIIRLDRVLILPNSAAIIRVWDIRQSDGLQTGQTNVHRLTCPEEVKSLRVTLVWSDPPAAVGAMDPVVNDLDLIVTSPEQPGLSFRGNVFEGGTSITGGIADSVNNVEMVIIDNPTAGEWSISVTGTAVNVGKPGQGYALVAGYELIRQNVDRIT